LTMLSHQCSSQEDFFQHDKIRSWNSHNNIAKHVQEKSFATLDCFVSVFVKTFNQCNGSVKKFKSVSVRAIRLEKKFATLRNDKEWPIYLMIGNGLQEMPIVLRPLLWWNGPLTF
jgi:hypothetical protein